MVSSSDAPSKDDGSRSSPTIDASHPYFLYPSDSPGMTLVTSVFDGWGYGGWRRSLLIALSTKYKLGFIDGSCSAPAFDSTSFSLWTRCNDMITSWLLNSLSKEIVASALYSKSAQALWTDLEDRFGQSNGAKLYHLQKEISDLMQGSSDIAGYFTKLKLLWDELDAIYTTVTCSCACTCSGKVKLVKSLQNERSNILMMSPLPSINIAYSLLVQDEKQREVYVNPQFPGDFSSFLATHQNISGQKSQSSDFKGRKNNLICSHCKKPGHSVDKCYRIIGFPSDFKFTKTPKLHGSVKSNAVLSFHAQPTGNTGGNPITQDQFSQLIHLLNNAQLGHTGSPTTKVNANVVQCVGNIFNNPSIYLTYANTHSWIIDSGASEHMSYDTKFFATLSPLPTPLFINLPNSFRVRDQSHFCQQVLHSVPLSSNVFFH
uniref:Retrotransposon Copia-like N-terminal domain-containing protein n=1 Tax=Nicotiana tabacum TaxID=4097 RepID=A0A1S3XRJ5_TOBAC|nr:PREDICTED: uncharacterized protein LOC107767981 [Nicotiana tabacum]